MGVPASASVQNSPTPQHSKRAFYWMLNSQRIQ